MASISKSILTLMFLGLVANVLIASMDLFLARSPTPRELTTLKLEDLIENASITTIPLSDEESYIENISISVSNELWKHIYEAEIRSKPFSAIYKLLVLYSQIISQIHLGQYLWKLKAFSGCVQLANESLINKTLIEECLIYRKTNETLYKFCILMKFLPNGVYALNESFDSTNIKAVSTFTAKTKTEYKNAFLKSYATLLRQASLEAEMGRISCERYANLTKIYNCSYEDYFKVKAEVYRVTLSRTYFLEDVLGFKHYYDIIFLAAYPQFNEIYLIISLPKEEFCNSIIKLNGEVAEVELASYPLMWIKGNVTEGRNLVEVITSNRVLNAEFSVMKPEYYCLAVIDYVLEVCGEKPCFKLLVSSREDILLREVCINIEGKHICKELNETIDKYSLKPIEIKIKEAGLKEGRKYSINLTLNYIYKNKSVSKNISLKAEYS